jgi:hypothetical protein
MYTSYHYHLQRKLKTKRGKYKNLVNYKLDLSVLQPNHSYP